MCPKCGSNDLWDDNFWWGCNKCDFMESCEPRFFYMVPVQPQYKEDDEGEEE